MVRGLGGQAGEEEGCQEETEGLPGAIKAPGQRMAPPSLDDYQKLQLHDPTRLRTRLFTPQGPFSQALLDIFTSRFTSAESFNFTWGLCLHKDYVACREFVAWKGGRCPRGGASCYLWLWFTGASAAFDLGLGCGLLLSRG